MLDMPNEREEEDQNGGVSDEYRETVEGDESGSDDNFSDMLNLHQEQTETKDPLADVRLDTREAAVFGSIFDGNEQSRLEESVIHSPDGTAKIKRVIDDDCEMTFEMDREVFKPVELGYQVKLNDLLSLNIPFKENVSSAIYICIYLFH